MQKTTPRLVLRPFEETDAEAMLRLIRNEQIAQTYMMPDLRDDARAAALFRRFLDLSHQPERAVVGMFADGALVGFMNDTRIEGGEIELGYVVDPAHQGRGYATEALKGMIEALFDRGFDTVMCGAFEENAASLRVMEKAGMSPIATTEEIEYRGVTHRCVYRAITKNG